MNNNQGVDISVIIPVGHRQSDPKSLYLEYRDALLSLGQSFEIVFVLDGAHLEFSTALKELIDSGEEITAVGLSRSFGEATALMAGFEHTSGQLILTLPAYYQVEPTEFHKLVERAGESDLVIARRWPRHANAFDRVRRNLFHALLSFVTGLRFQDLGCSVRCLHKTVFSEIHLYGEQHRYFPLLADRLGFRVTEIDVSQSSKDRYVRGYSFREYLRSIIDIFSIFFITRFTKRPLRFFGTAGAVTASIGGAALCWLVFERLVFDVSLADRPALMLASLLVVLGLQLFALGLLGEIVIFTHARDMKDYYIEKTIRFDQTTGA